MANRWNPHHSCARAQADVAHIAKTARSVLVTFEEYTCHIDWSLTVGQRRPHQTARRAASTRRELRPHGIRVNALALQLLDPRKPGRRSRPR
jgi:hypothetical protein